MEMNSYLSDKFKKYTSTQINNKKEKISSNDETKDIKDFSLDAITNEILNLKNQISINIIEIGKRLNIVKDNLEHGEFGKWLEEKVDFSQRTAQMFMKIATEFSNTNLNSFLGQRKLYLLAGLKTKEREEFMQEYNVADMTTRELEKILQEKKGTKEPKFTGKIKKITFKKYRDRFNTDDDFDELIDKLLSEYFENN